jgi:hypothetical protein
MTRGFITHETVSALAQYDNNARLKNRNQAFSHDVIAKVDKAITSLPPEEQKAILWHYILKICERGCDHGEHLQEGLNSLSHYISTGGVR